MPNNPSLPKLDFARYALQRNDDAIRYSETKAGLLLALIAILFATVGSEITDINKIIINNYFPSTTILDCSLIVLIPSIILLVIVSLETVMPRLHVTQTISYLYFGSLSSINEIDLLQKFPKLTQVEMNHQLLAQVHATAKIAQRKFELMRIATISAGFVLLGSAGVLAALLMEP